MSALIVVDLQHDFLKGSLAVAEAETIVPTINKLLSYKWDYVVATRDWHPFDHTSFAAQHKVDPSTAVTFEHPTGEKGPDGKVIKKEQVTWPVHCVQDTEGAQLDHLFKEAFDKLKTPKSVVDKGKLRDREYYSCFQDVWGLHKTGLNEQLKSHGITEVVFVGLAFDYCVLLSAIDCAKLGYKTIMLTDGSKSVNPSNYHEVEKRLRDVNVELMTLDEFKNGKSLGK